MQLSRDQKTGAIFILMAILLVFVWIPSTSTPAILKKSAARSASAIHWRPPLPGPSFLIGGLGLLVFGGNSGEAEAPTDLLALRFAAILFGVYFVSFLVMLVVGPAAVWLANLFTGSEQEYRLLRDTAPWKYLGFATGGTLAVAGTISLLEGRATLRALVTGILAVCAMIAITTCRLTTSCCRPTETSDGNA